MRDIKFRVYANGSMMPVTRLEWHEGDDGVEAGLRAYVGKYTFAKPDNLMQFTGLKDKNGKEIHEGDILHFYWKNSLSSSSEPIDNYYEVVFQDGQFQQMRIYKDDLSYRSEVAIWYEWKELEVVGNIYENKDLIKENK